MSGIAGEHTGIMGTLAGHRVAVTIVIALLVLLVNGGISYYNTRQLAEYQDQVVGAHAVLSGLNVALIALDDAETGQRGYLLTGQKSYLSPYDAAVRRVGSDIARIRTLTRNNPALRRGAARLTSLSKEKLRELGLTVRLRSQGRTAEALRIVRSDIGQRTMASLRQDITRMQSQENRVLEIKNSQARAHELRANAGIVVATLANIALLGMVFLLGRREIRRREGEAAERAAILGHIADAVLVADPTGRIGFANAAAGGLLGSDLVGQPVDVFSTVLHTRDPHGRPLKPEETPLGRAITSGVTSLDCELTMAVPGGTDMIVEASAAPVTIPGQPPIGAVTVLRNVTAQRSLQRDKDSFLNATAHELRTPLAIIKGVAQNLQRRAGRTETLEAPQILDSLTRIDSTASRMARLIDEMLDITSLQMEGEIDLVKRPTNLQALTEHAAADARRAYPNHAIVLEAQDGEIVGRWDAGRLERVVRNLLSNALKYSPTGSSVHVTLRRDGTGSSPSAVLVVSDKGIGIPHADAARVWHPFGRGTNTGEVAGAGIGLTTAAEIVRLHGGTIDLQSAEGRGTTVTVRLPLGLEPSDRYRIESGAAAH